MRRAFVLELAADTRAAEDLAAGGVFIPNAFVEFDDECHVVLRAGGEELTVTARAVQVLDTGSGFQIEGLTPELRERIAAMVEAAKHVDLDLERKKTRTRGRPETLDISSRRSPAGSIPPTMRRGAVRVAEGSISPILAFAPTQEHESLAEKARAAQLAAEKRDDNTDD